MIVPERLTNFRVYGGGGAVELFGSSDVELPKFDAMTEKIMGAGIAGEVDSPVIGHYQAMTLKLKWRTVTEEGLLLVDPAQHSIQLRGSIQVTDSKLGASVHQPLKVDVRGLTKSWGLGKLEPGKAMDAETEVEVVYIVVELAGKILIELDKFNMVFKVNGVDRLRDVRVNLGGV